MCMTNTYYYTDIYESKQKQSKLVLDQDNRNKRYSKWISENERMIKNER